MVRVKVALIGQFQRPVVVLFGDAAFGQLQPCDLILGRDLSFTALQGWNFRPSIIVMASS